MALPVFTLGFKLWTQACAGEMFDPTPTWCHALLVALVPATHAAALLLLNRKDRTPPAWLWWAHSFVTGVAGGYALVFLPLTPFALIGTVFLIGFLPLSPLLAWICALVVSSALKQQAAQTSAVPPARRWLGWAAALLCLAAPSAPGLLTHRWLETAVHGSPEESTRAVQWLRRFGSEDSLLRACYGQTRGVWSGLGRLERQWMSAEQIQAVFFRVTGQPYNARKPPLSSLRGPGVRTLRDFEWDNAVGGTAVAGHVSGLSLHSSSLDAMGNADDGWSYTEWTLEFRNDHDFQPREARAELQLPPGGVVSRVTLWVNGEEREAAFAGTGHLGALRCRRARAMVGQPAQEVRRMRRSMVILLGVGLVFGVPLLMGVWLPDVFTATEHTLAEQRLSTGHVFRVVQYWNRVDFYSTELRSTAPDSTFEFHTLDGDDTKRWRVHLAADERHHLAAITMSRGVVRKVMWR